jgi:hypothetical protein
MAGADSVAGRDKPKCGGKRRGEGAGKLCTRPAGWGTAHPGTGRCKLHGGKTPSHERAGQRARAEQAVATLGLPREVDPRDALLEEVHRAAGAVAWLDLKVRALDPDEVIWGRTEEVAKTSGEYPGTDTKYAAAPNVWVQLWQDERRELRKACKEAIAAGIEERKVRLAEQHGALMAGVIQAILGDLDLSPQQQAKVPTVVPFRLRQVATAA